MILQDDNDSREQGSFRPTIGSVTLCVVTAIYILAVANYTFWTRAHTYLSSSPLAFAAFVIGVSAGVVAVITAFSVKYLVKPVLIFLIVTSVLAAWFTDQFGVVIDKEMIRNAIDTTRAESQHLITPSFLLNLIVKAVLPSLLIVWVKVRHRNFLHKVKQNFAVIIPCVAILLAAGLGFSQTYAAVGRIHQDLVLTLNPVIPIANAARLAFSSGKEHKIEPIRIGLDARQEAASATGKPRVTIIVAGETARAQNFSLGGYARETNPQMKAQDVIYFSDVASCGTSTAVSIPCMFSVYTRKQYDHGKAAATDNLTDILTRAGVKVEWWDNDTGSYGVADRIAYRFLPTTADPRFCRDGECLDTILLDGLDDWLAKVKTDSVLVLHQLGSHGPAYYQRYPDDFRRFTPDCRTAEFGKCKPEEVVNAYDNTLLFTDHVVGRVIDTLKRHEQNVSAAMIYLSDHGESLGESGIYLHGAPYLIAPSQQTHVPLALWFSTDFSRAEGIDLDCLKANADKPISHDNFFHSILALMAVKTTAYDPSLDMVASCRKPANKMAMD